MWMSNICCLKKNLAIEVHIWLYYLLCLGLLGPVGLIHIQPGNILLFYYTIVLLRCLLRANGESFHVLQIFLLLLLYEIPSSALAYSSSSLAHHPCRRTAWQIAEIMDISLHSNEAHNWISYSEMALGNEPRIPCNLLMVHSGEHAHSLTNFL